MRRAVRLALAVPALVLPACVSSVPRSGLVPGGPAVTRIEELSGDYCFAGLDFNVRSYRRTAADIPFLDVEALEPLTVVSVRVEADSVVFSHADADCRGQQEIFQFSDAEAAWRGDALVIEKREPRPRPDDYFGVFVDSGWQEESRLFRLEDGRLVMTDVIRRRGHEMREDRRHIVFFREEEAVALILDPFREDCAEQAAKRGREPWFDVGPDLRDPACAARLEAELAAMLVNEDETPADSANMAADALTSFRTGTRVPWDFQVSSWTGDEYGFRVGMKKTGCSLVLWRRWKEDSIVSASRGLVSRPLPDCVCND